MKRFKRLTALLLCILMMFPSQSIAVLAETEGQNVVIETAEVAEVETESESELEENLRIKETLPLQPLEGSTWRDEMVIYWNPGGVLPDNLATASDAQKATVTATATATGSSAKRGSDTADGLSPSTPVKTLAAALERAQIMQEEEGVIASDITIYAMNPMEISDGQLYILTGGQIKIVSWPGRTYDDETIFYVNGGQLTLINTRLESGNPDTDAEEAGLVLVQGGSLQMGQNVEINGRIVLDYREEKEDAVWNVATASDASIKVETATSSDAGLSQTEGEEGGFDLNDYILDTDEETLELLEDSKNASTWREPVIELMEDFYGAEKSYLLDVLGDDSTPQMELVKTLYADAESEEAFMELFALSETTDSSWQLTVETQTAGRLRNTDLTDRMVGSELLTLKTLVATPFNTGAVVYWNPGEALPGYPAGNDDGYFDGKGPNAPLKTWKKAVDTIAAVGGGTIICMQSVNLGSEDAKNYVPIQSDGSFLIDGSFSASSNMIALRSWESNIQPAFIVPDEETLVLKNVVLRGITRDGEENYVQTILSEKGSLIIEENVVADKGFIQVNAFAGMENHPIKVTSTDSLYDGKITLMFGGINQDLSYRNTNVVIPWGDLETSVKQGSEEANTIGDKLNKRFQLHKSNRSVDNGGDAKFDWYLRQDTIEDDKNEEPEKLELYTEYYFNAVYLNGEEGRGDDSNYGATCQYPVKTWEQAKTIWEKEMAKSIEARNKAEAAKRTPEEIDELYPLPNTIYICGTVTVENTPQQPWTLKKIPDYDGKLITTEVVSHVDIPISEDGINPVHELPKVLVEVAVGVILTIEDVTFRGITDESDSVTIQVADGGTLILKETAVLTGERLADGKTAAKEVTLGTHVKVKDGGKFIMDTTWQGAIERRQRGVDASGSRARITMEHGEIRENNSFEQSRYDEKDTNHQPGAGVVLGEGATFIMNGGAITRNKVYAYGAGIYMTGEKTTFVMNKGEISHNEMAMLSEYKNSSNVTEGKGIGIYAGSDTVLNIGNGITKAEEIIITENKGYLASGVGIWADGLLKVNQATVSLNQAGGYRGSNISKGIGIFISANGTLNMDNGWVVENHSIVDSGYGNAHGAGIYIDSMKGTTDNPNIISNSTISKNKTGKQDGPLSPYYSKGGGIYLADSLIIEGTEISYNEAQEGGGICFRNESWSKRVELEIGTTKINNNIARNYSNRSYGTGGGIYFYRYGTIVLKDETLIFENEAKTSGGGIYVDGESGSSATINMRGKTPGAIKIHHNESQVGGGISASHIRIQAENVEISKNKATSNGGGLYTMMGTVAYMRDVTVVNNEAKSSGGGFYLFGNVTYRLKDLKVIDNVAANGGGFYLDETDSYNINFHLTETKPGDFDLKRNHASENGGGIFINGSSNFIMNIAGEIQNSADKQGSNLYLTRHGNIYLLSGNFKQPEEEKRVAGVYNIYLDDTSAKSNGKYFDMSDLTFEKKTKENPEVIYLNTANSYLTYLTAPEKNDAGAFPIDLNIDAFKVGSIIIKPANEETVRYESPRDNMNGVDGNTKKYTKLINAAINLDYSSGGKRPRRTDLGGFVDGNLTNVVLLGEGVYLSGKGDDDKNEGRSPDDAVKTFAKAKELLEKRIKDASNDVKDEDGFVPFIYICGQVDVVKDESMWVLDHETEEFDTKNQKYKDAEKEHSEPVYPAQIRRFTSFVNAPMIQVGDGSSAVDFKTGRIIIEGMADAVILSDQKDRSPVIKVMENSKVTLTGDSQIKNNYYQGIEVLGSLILTSEGGNTNKQLLNHHGYSVQMHENSSIEMQGESKILAEGEISRISTDASKPAAIFAAGDNVTITMTGFSSIEEKSTGSMLQHGIYSTYDNTTIVMQEDASITSSGSSMRYGIYMEGEKQKITMRDRAKIDGGNTKLISNGIYIRGSVHIEMCDFSELSNFASLGIHSYSSSDVTVDMNMNEGANKEDSAKISNVTSCIYSQSGSGFQLSMGKHALLSQATVRGILFGNNQGDTKTNILMKDYSSISKCEYGIEFYLRNTIPIHIEMKDHAAIEQNTYGLRERTTTGYGITRLDLDMSGSSRISGNEYIGINLEGNTNYSFDNGDYRNITLKDEAVIGGNSYYDSTNSKSGNGRGGICSTGPIILQMSGNSKISGNGNDNDKELKVIELRRASNSYYATGTSKISLIGNASICNNIGSIYVNSGIPTCPNPCEILLDAETPTPEEGTPSIQNNTEGIYLGGGGILKLKGDAILGDTTYETESYEKRSLDCYGKLELDGRSVIGGRIYLQNSENPITMTHEVTDPDQLYHLWLSEGFLGQTVVQPDKDGMMDVTKPDQFTYFRKDGGDGVAAEKLLSRQSPEIVLLGENNVYLSGAGDDGNDGNSPVTAVKTFKRARQLLKEEYFTTGANIIICNSVVSVQSDDGDWSFDPGGTVTNAKSGNTWKPLVVRYKHYSGQLIGVYTGSTEYASTVTFKNITIDGGAEEGTILDTNSDDELLFIDYGKKVILGEGAVFQNNQSVTSDTSSGSSLGVMITGGTLEIDGGTIRNIVRESTKSFSRPYSASASAIYCRSNVNDPGRIIMRSGQIVDNQLICPNVSGPDAYLGTIYLKDRKCELDLSGGLIAGNKVVSYTSSVANSGAIVFYQATVKISGGIIRDNEGGRGSAIYYEGTNAFSGSLQLSGGQITGNWSNATHSKNNQGAYSPIFINGPDFQLKGGGADVKDNIYLRSTDNNIKVSGAMYQTGRKYQVYLYQGTSIGEFKKGSVVVQPDGNVISDVTPYLSYFQVRTNPYILDIGKMSKSVGPATNISENKCLILMKAVYLDSENGNDNNNGSTPRKAVASFSVAKGIGSSREGSDEYLDYYVIYISGKTWNTKSEQTWTLPEPAYMCRYTGFPVYEKDGSETPEIELPYYNYLIEPKENLILEKITIYGRRTMDSIESNGESLINIKTGIQVTMDEGTILERNYNVGTYLAEDNISDNLISEGGAIRVEGGGVLSIKAGVIQGTDAAYGSAIYLEAGKTANSLSGKLYLTGNPKISGKVYLDGTGSATAAYIEPDGGYKPEEVLRISLRNDYNGRTLVSYHDETELGYAEMNYYAFDDAVQALYDIVKRPVGSSNKPTSLVLNMRRVLYLDGQKIDGTRDGKTPDTAFGTLKEVYESLGKQTESSGVLVFVVDTVEISTSAEGPDHVLLSNVLIKEDDGNRHYKSTYQEGEDEDKALTVQGQVYFKRYVKPDDYKTDESVYDSFDVDTHMETLFSVADGGKLTLNGIYVDGHSQDSQNTEDVTLNAKGVTAMSPLVRVDGTGELLCYRSEDSKNAGVTTATLFTNNINDNNKNSQKEFIGELNGSDIMEGSSAGIELLNGGKCTLEYAQFSNLNLGKQVISGGTDVYSNGFLHFSNETFFTGTVFLEGIGTPKNNQVTSRYLTVDVYGKPLATNFQVLMRDPYNGREVVHFPNKKDTIPTPEDAGFYRLEERVKDFFCLTNRDDAKYILELQVPVSVYINGSIGVDNPQNRVAGSTPKSPVKTLKRAFELLKTRGGNTIYVVDTVQITTDAYITGNSYDENDGEEVTLGSTNKVHLVRYIQPDFAKDNADAAADTEYDVGDFTGVLLNVKTGATARFGNNVFFDGHSEPKTDADYPDGLIVSGNSEAKAPLITVAKGGTLELGTGVTLQDNNNTYQNGDTGVAGGVLYNSGSTTVDGVSFINNKATWESDIYQDGIFTILGTITVLENMVEEPGEPAKPGKPTDLSFYLTTEKTGTSGSPVWGEDHIIQTAVMIPDGQIFDVDMDRAVKGRDVVRFTDSSAYTPNVDAEHEHFRLGNRVPENLFLVQAIQDEMVLELQDWEVFDVEVPTDIYLVVNQKGDNHVTTRLSGIITETEDTSLFSAPEYTIKNKGIYDVQVSVKGFVNQNAEVGISHEVMNLVETSADATTNMDLYLAVKGLDDGDGSGGTGFTMEETSLKPYAEEVVAKAPAKLGVLKSGTDGNFTFVGKVGDGFVEKYLDPDFPIEGKTGETVQQYMDGTSEDGLIHARAKYGLKYKLEMVPSRRGSNITP